MSLPHIIVQDKCRMVKALVGHRSTNGAKTLCKEGHKEIGRGCIVPGCHHEKPGTNFLIQAK